MSADTDDAIRTAAKAAIDARDYRRARALLEQLDIDKRATPRVLMLALKQGQRQRG